MRVLDSARRLQNRLPIKLRPFPPSPNGGDFDAENVRQVAFSRVRPRRIARTKQPASPPRAPNVHGLKGFLSERQSTIPIRRARS
eukprot:928420-Pyramimonas_sp.AAC.1